MKTSSENRNALFTLRNYISEVVGDYSMAASRRLDAPGNLRSGMRVIGQRGNVLSDEQTLRSNDHPTVRILVTREDGKVLTVVDPNDSQHVGLPGGGIEPGESEVEAAHRELWEETGLVPKDVIELKKHVVGSRPVTLFKAIKVSGDLRGSDEGDVMWVDPSSLTMGKFGNYYSIVFKEIGLL